MKQIVNNLGSETFQKLLLGRRTMSFSWRPNWQCAFPQTHKSHVQGILIHSSRMAVEMCVRRWSQQCHQSWRLWNMCGMEGEVYTSSAQSSRWVPPSRCHLTLSMSQRPFCSFSVHSLTESFHCPLEPACYLFSLVLFQDRVSGSPDGPWTLYIAEADLELVISCLFLPGAVLQVWAIMSCLFGAWDQTQDSALSELATPLPCALFYRPSFLYILVTVLILLGLCVGPGVLSYSLQGYDHRVDLAYTTKQSRIAWRVWLWDYTELQLTTSAFVLWLWSPFHLFLSVIFYLTFSTHE